MFSFLTAAAAAEAAAAAAAPEDKLSVSEIDGVAPSLYYLYIRAEAENQFLYLTVAISNLQRSLFQTVQRAFFAYK